MSIADLKHNHEQLGPSVAAPGVGAPSSAVGDRRMARIVDNALNRSTVIAAANTYQNITSAFVEDTETPRLDWSFSAAGVLTYTGSAIRSVYFGFECEWQADINSTVTVVPQWNGGNQTNAEVTCRPTGSRFGSTVVRFFGFALTGYTFSVQVKSSSVQTIYASELRMFVD